MKKNIWKFPPENLHMENRELHVWRGALGFEKEMVNHMEEVLSEEEKTKARRFYFQEGHMQYVATKFMLRCLLGEYLNIAPRLLEFSYNEYGKPCLAQKFNAPGINFNLSHSSGLSLVSVALGMETGVDIERINEDIDFMEISEKFFSGNEKRKLALLSGEARTAAFFKCWTRKEAYLKARGLGICSDISSFEVSLCPDEPAALLGPCDSAGDIAMWLLLDIDASEGYAGAVAVDGEPASIGYFDFSFEKN